jgi:HEXXH motif-containing protein
MRSPSSTRGTNCRNNWAAADLVGEVLSTHLLTRAGFDELCAGPVSGDTMALLGRSQYSHRRLALRALLDQLRANPAVVGNGVAPEEAWRTLAEAERRNAEAVADILMHPTVGVWLTRALHHTRPGRTTPWPELGYLHLVSAAAAVRCGCPGSVRVPVWHGIVSLPTVGHARIPGTFPVGAVDVICAASGSRIQVNHAVTIPLDGTSSAFTTARQHVSTSRGVTLRAWIEDRDPYHAFGEPRPPTELTGSEYAEWCKLLDEAWDLLTLNHPASARELAAGLRALGPIEPDLDTVGASSAAAFGGIRLSAGGSATDFAEALVHEMQHSKLNALLGLVTLTDNDDGRYLAPWRDDPRPLVGLVHGVFAFTCGVEFWLAQEPVAQEDEACRMAFAVAYRRAQIRRAIHTLTTSGNLTRPGEALVDAVSARLAVCEQSVVGANLSQTVTTMIDDHQALWRLRHARPDMAAVAALATAWLDGGAPPAGPHDSATVTTDDGRRLPSNRRTLLRAKATEPELFASLVRVPASLPGTTPRADAALCTGDYPGAATAYENRLHADPDDTQAWVGLGLALRAQGRTATALLEHPELTVAVHRQVRMLGRQAPDPVALSGWMSSAL